MFRADCRTRSRALGGDPHGTTIGETADKMREVEIDRASRDIWSRAERLDRVERLATGTGVALLLLVAVRGVVGLAMGVTVGAGLVVALAICCPIAIVLLWFARRTGRRLQAVRVELAILDLAREATSGSPGIQASSTPGSPSV